MFLLIHFKIPCETHLLFTLLFPNKSHNSLLVGSASQCVLKISNERQHKCALLAVMSSTPKYPVERVPFLFLFMH